MRPRQSRFARRNLNVIFYAFTLQNAVNMLGVKPEDGAAAAEWHRRNVELNEALAVQAQTERLQTEGLEAAWCGCRCYATRLSFHSMSQLSCSQLLRLTLISFHAAVAHIQARLYFPGLEKDDQLGKT